ncbi:HPP family protein [Kaarinaea lacus]
MQTWFDGVKRFFGVEAENISTAEKLVSVMGSFFGIFFIALVSHKTIGAQGTAIIVPSMGAAAVLLFAVPHGRLSQPWALFGGNSISALIGVSCYKLFPDPMLSGALAVGLSIGAMHILSCMHPPGGATALVAVVGGPAIHDLGYKFLFMPVLLNVVIIFFVAIVFNSVFPWRRYPASIMRFTSVPGETSSSSAPRIEKRFIEKAMEDMDKVVDLTTDDIQRLITLTLEHTDHANLSPKDIVLGRYYTNGKHGAEWSVRQIIDESQSPTPDNDMVIYRVVEGRGLKSADSCTRDEFARWAAREVFSASKR